MIPYVLGAIFVLMLAAVWMWHARRSDPANYASSSGFAKFEEALLQTKL